MKKVIFGAGAVFLADKGFNSVVAPMLPTMPQIAYDGIRAAFIALSVIYGLKLAGSAL